MLSLTSVNDFKLTRIPCGDIKYTYNIEGSINTYIRTRNEEYLTRFNSDADLRVEIDKQCKK